MPDGSTYADHVRQGVESLRRTGKLTPEEEENLLAGISPPDLPPGIDHIWENYITLRKHARPGLYGPSYISFDDINAWVSLYNIDLAPWEIDCLFSIDDLWMRKNSEHNRPKAKSTSS